MTDPREMPTLASESEIVAEASEQECAERWLLARQVALVLVLVALLLSRALLG